MGTGSNRTGSLSGRTVPFCRIRLPAGMALEAAFAVPLFLFFMVNMIYIVEIIRLQDRISSAVHQAGNQVAEYAYYYRYGLKEGIDPEESESAGGIAGAAASFAVSQTYVRNTVADIAGREYLDHSPLKGGSGGISYLRSSILSGAGGSGDIISINADYRAGPLIPWLGYPEITLQSRYYGHAFTGYTPGSGADSTERGEEEEETVYVTETGSVYHRSTECSYLRLSVTPVSRDSIRGYRNNDGAKYYPCEICRPDAGGAAGGTVLITDDGNRYHCSRECSGLKRTIRALPLKEAQQYYAPCSRCGG